MSKQLSLSATISVVLTAWLALAVTLGGTSDIELHRAPTAYSPFAVSLGR